MSDNEIQDPQVTLSDVSYTYPEEDLPVFMSLSIELPKGMVALVGQNGTGKSTTLLLAGGRILPDIGSVSVLGKDTREFSDEDEKNRYVSFVYQNMEFETDEKIGDLMGYVYEHGFHENRDPSLITTLVGAFELSESLNKSTQTVSKGELQRAIMAFSLLYGS
ncbi:MAG TPA: ATP-binding cassette domain-containing protein, partial [Spirochaetia bacterium]|nr:ATP-binding cassette domain-containing protein [Spirochaetia bacterium]